MKLKTLTAATPSLGDELRHNDTRERAVGIARLAPRIYDDTGDALAFIMREVPPRFWANALAVFVYRTRSKKLDEIGDGHYLHTFNAATNMLISDFIDRVPECFATRLTQALATGPGSFYTLDNKVILWRACNRAEKDAFVSRKYSNVGLWWTWYAPYIFDTLRYGRKKTDKKAARASTEFVMCVAVPVDSLRVLCGGFHSVLLSSSAVRNSEIHKVYRTDRLYFRHVVRCYRRDLRRKNSVSHFVRI